MSSILILGWGGDQKYTIKDSVGAVIDIKKGGFGMIDICGFMVEEGQEYELSFDGTAGLLFLRFMYIIKLE